MSAPPRSRAKRCGHKLVVRQQAGVSDKELSDKLSAALKRLGDERPSYRQMQLNMSKARANRWAHRKGSAPELPNDQWYEAHIVRDEHGNSIGIRGNMSKK